MLRKITTLTILLRSTVVVLLLFNGVGALFGGWNLITHPDGGTLQLSLHWLEHTPFRDYFVPGLILFTANGLLSTLALGCLFFSIKKHELLIAGQGMILTGWILIQVILIRTFHPFHFILGSVGITLFISGYALWRLRPKSA